MSGVEPADPQVLATGTAVGPYIVVGRLGRGGMGQVFLARDTRLQRKVALKYLTSSANSEAVRAAILREARAAARINHPSVAAIHDVFDDGGRTFIVMEYVDGESLSARLARERLSLPAIVAIARQLAAGLSAAHAQGIIHRDLKPSNVQMTSGGAVKILDFGIAKSTSSLLSTRSAGQDELVTDAGAAGGRPGTPAYMSPEQKLAGSIDERSDIYSLGLVMFEMATGRRPEPTHTVDLALGTPMRPPRADAADPRVPHELASIIEKAMEPDRERRFGSAGELDAALDALELPVEQTKPAWRRYQWLGIAAAAMAALAVLGYVGSTASKPRQIRSLAVLPLLNESRDPRQDYLVDGMTDGLINTLGQMGALQVTARTSSMQFKNSTKSIAEIARELDVDAVLEGSVRIDGPANAERVFLAVNLVDPSTQKVIWSDKLDRDIVSVIALQTDVARALAGKIDLAVTPAERGRLSTAAQVKPEAYKLYLLGRQRWNMRTVAALLEALDFFQQAIAKDSSYAPAYAGLADTYVLLAGEFGAMPRGEGATAATASATTALSIDPDLAEAYASLGFTNFFLEWKWTTAEEHLRHAITLNSSYATAHQWLGNFLSDMGREDEGLAEIRRALEIDPLSAIISRDVAWPLFFTRRYDEAIQQLQTTLREHPDYLPAERLLARAQAMKGETADAVAAFERQQKRDDNPRSRSELAWAYALAGRARDATQMLESARAMPSLAGYPYDEALVLAALGKTAEALDALDRAFEQRDPTLVNLKHDPRFDRLRSDPRYGKLLALMRFP
jgi:eukaryotic-like serine/threonine-protein kinase